jgi:site-specific DNA recombinase
MIAALYARKSTDQAGAGDKSESVERQIAHARAYAARKGWTVADAHVYADDGISGAEFGDRRPGLARLLNALRPRPPFQVLVMSEESRLGREQIEVAYALKRVAQAGVHVWLYLQDRERTLDSSMDKMQMSVTAFADELERERARQRTHDALVRKARAGRVTGGVVFGYRNREVLAEASTDGPRRRLYVERVIGPAEAAVVRRIFELCAQGRGVKRIAMALNDERAPAPVPRRRGRPRSWAPSSIREVLHRSLYRGEIVWNRTQKRNHWGEKCYRERPESEWIRLADEGMRIVSETLWGAAHARLAASRASYLRGTRDLRWGRPASGIDSKYLLTGMATCAACGGGMVVASRDWKTRRQFRYVCGYHHTRGAAVCANRLEAPMDSTNREILVSFEHDLLRPEVLNETIRKALAALRPSSDTTQERGRLLRRELVGLDEELTRLAAAIATAGGEVPTLLAAIREREGRRQRLQAELASLEGLSRVSALDLRRLEHTIRERFADWRGLAERHVQRARPVLQAALVGRFVFTPHAAPSTSYYEIASRWSIGRAIASIIEAKGLVTPAGFEPAISTLKGSRPGPG